MAFFEDVFSFSRVLYLTPTLGFAAEDSSNRELSVVIFGKRCWKWFFGLGLASAARDFGLLSVSVVA